MKTKKLTETKVAQNHEIGDETALSEDGSFLNTLVGKKLQIVGVKLEKDIDVSYTCSNEHGLTVIRDTKPFYFVDADLKKYKSTTTTIEDIIKTHICEDIFQNGYPTDLDNLHPYDFFMRADVDCTIDVESSPLCTEWNFEVSGEYALDNIRCIRGTMQSMYSDLERLKSSLFKHAVKMVNVSLDDFEDSNRFYDFIQDANANLYEQGTPSEHATILTVDVEVVS